MDDKGPVLMFEWFSRVKEAGRQEEGSFPSIFSGTHGSTWTGPRPSNAPTANAGVTCF